MSCITVVNTSKCTNASTARYSLVLCVYELLIARISEQKSSAG